MADTEKLKKVAERLGYEVDQDSVIVDDTYFPLSHVDPRANPAQLVECIEWLLRRGDTLMYEINEYLIVTESADHAVGRTLADAVIDAIAGEDDD